MNWIQHKVELDKINQFYQDYLKAIQKGEAELEHFYCVFQFQDDININILSIFDFIDNYQQLKNTQIKKFYSYQLKNVKSSI